MEIIAQKRQENGKKAQSLRNDRLMPAVMFGKGQDSISLTVDLNNFIKVFSIAGENTLVDIAIEGAGKEKVLIKDVQLDPITLSPIHAGFHKVNLKEKITAQIPVEIIGSETNPLVKSGDGLVLTLLDEVSVEALPSDLPSSFVVDVSGIEEIGDGITVSQLDYDRNKVEIVGHEEDEMIVKIDHAVMEEVAEEVSEEEALAKVEASEELTEEEKKEREAEENEE